MLRVHPADDLALVKAQADGVIGLPLPGLPGRALALHDPGQPVEVRDGGPVHSFIEAEEPCLVTEQLADRGPLLAGLGELRPVGSDPLLVVEPAARLRERHGHGGHALRSREHEGHRVLLPRGASGAVPNAAPQVDDSLAGLVDAAGRADLTAMPEALDEGLAHGLPARCDRPLDRDLVRYRPGHRPHLASVAVRPSGANSPDGAHLEAQPAGGTSIVGRMRGLIRALTPTVRAPGHAPPLPPGWRHRACPSRVEMRLDSAHRHEQLRRGLAVGPADGDESQDLELAGRERFDQALTSEREAVSRVDSAVRVQRPHPLERRASRPRHLRVTGARGELQAATGSRLGGLHLAELQPCPGECGPDRAAYPRPSRRTGHARAPLRTG